MKIGEICSGFVCVVGKSICLKLKFFGFVMVYSIWFCKVN